MEDIAAKKIIETKDVNSFSRLNDEDMESCFIELLYQHFYKMPFQELNYVQRTLFLCMVLEDHCQADGILSVTEEDELFFLLPQTKKALLDIQAPNTAKALQEFMDFLPDGTFEKQIIPEWDWFMDKENRTVIERIDSEISDYPDGLMRGLYRKFVLSMPDFVSELLQI